MMWIVFTLLAAVFRGLSDTLKKRAYRKFPLINALGGFSIMMFVVSIPLFFVGVDYFIPINTLILIATLAALSFISSFFLGASYQTEEVSIVAPLFNLSPALLLIFSFLLLKEQPSLLQIIGVIVIIIGGYLLTTKSMKTWHHPFTEIAPRHLFYMVIVLFIATFLAIINKVTLLSVSIWTAYVWYVIFNTLFFVFFLLFKKRFIPSLKAIKNSPKEFIVPTVLGSISLLLLYAAMTIPQALVSLIIPTLRVSTIITILLGGRMFHEHNIIHKLIASGIMIIGVFIISIT